MLKTHPERDRIYIENVFAALAHPIRLQIVKILSDGKEHTCGSMLPDIAKSTLTHHWRILRDSGIIWQKAHGRENLLSLRRDDLDARFPHLLEVILREIQ